MLIQSDLSGFVINYINWELILGWRKNNCQIWEFISYMEGKNLREKEMSELEKHGEIAESAWWEENGYIEKVMKK